MKDMLKKVDLGKVAAVTSTIIGVAGVLLSNVVEKNNRNDMKAQLKDEILKELANKNE